MGVASVTVTVDTAVSESVASVAASQPVTPEAGATDTVNVSSSSASRSVAVGMVMVAVVALWATVTVAGGLERSVADAGLSPEYP